MMLVPTYVAHSKIQGLGLFATKKIYRNTPMQMDNPIFDIILTPPQVAALIPIARDHIARYAWTDDAGLKHIGVDNDKYVNHADDPNMGVPEGETSEVCVALRDIEVGEEITEVYRWPGDDYVTVTPES
jgi:hypothetical protein